MKSYLNLTPLEKKARKASGRICCANCPIYGLCLTNKKISDACDYIFLKAYKSGYNQHKREIKNKNKIIK